MRAGFLLTLTLNMGSALSHPQRRTRPLPPSNSQLQVVNPRDQPPKTQQSGSPCESEPNNKNEIKTQNPNPETESLPPKANPEPKRRDLDTWVNQLQKKEKALRKRSALNLVTEDHFADWVDALHQDEVELAQRSITDCVCHHKPSCPSTSKTLRLLTIVDS